MVKRFLITSALEDTWVFDTPVIFLGEWCRRKSRESQWKSIDSITIKYHWDDREKLKKDYFFIETIYESLLKETADQLNFTHKVDFSHRYWRILIGPWLGYFTQVIFDRWETIEAALHNFNIDSCKVLLTNDVELVPNDMTEFLSLIVSDEWNEAIYAQILQRYFINRIDIQSVVNKKSSKSNKVSKVNKLKFFINGLIDKINGYSSKPDDYFFRSTYLPFRINYKVQQLLGQLPKFWRDIPSPVSALNLELRNWSWEKNNDKDLFYQFMQYLIPKSIPILYLEGYSRLNSKIDNLSWPSSPRVIFTSNSYSQDDIFKAWAALKTENGSPLVIGQHGGNFGMTPYSFHEKHQIEIADAFLSWGWSKESNPKIIPFGNFKSSSENLDYDKNGPALMVEMTVPRYSNHVYSIPISSQWLYYFADQCKFYETLPERLRSQINLRLYSTDYGWDQKLLWNDKFPNIQIDNGSQDIRKLISKSRLYISTYNATTYLESLNWNIPTIIFWDENFWEINDDVKSYFDLLKSVGIFHDTPEGAANKMIEVWDDIDSWWFNENLQMVREKFCNRFSKTPNSLMINLHDVLKKIEIKGYK